MWIRAMVVAAAAGTASADNYVETFTGGSNAGGWWWGTGGEVIEGSGGNPGEFLRDSFLDTFAPQLGTLLGKASAFTGDFASRNVTKVGVDLKLFHVDFSAEGRPLSLILRSTNGTPEDFDDDWGAYVVGDANIPLVGQGWLSYEFEVPSQSATLPAGWKIIQYGPTSPANPEWSDLITSVDQVVFFYGDPDFFFIFQMWDVGADNVRISTGCKPDCEGDGDLDVFDFLCFQGKFAQQDPYADFEGDGDWDVFDFLAFQGAYANGCD